MTGAKSHSWWEWNLGWVPRSLSNLFSFHFLFCAPLLTFLIFGFLKWPTCQEEPRRWCLSMPLPLRMSHNRESKSSFNLNLWTGYWKLIFKKFYCIFFHYHLVPLYPPEITTLLSMSWVLFPFCSIPSTPNHPHPAPTSCHLLSIYESVFVLLVSSVCSLDSTYKWNHMVFVFLWLAYFM